MEVKMNWDAPSNTANQRKGQSVWSHGPSCAARTDPPARPYFFEPIKTHFRFLQTSLLSLHSLAQPPPSNYLATLPIFFLRSLTGKQQSSRFFSDLQALFHTHFFWYSLFQICGGCCCYLLQFQCLFAYFWLLCTVLFGVVSYWSIWFFLSGSVKSQIFLLWDFLHLGCFFFWWSDLYWLDL